MPRRSNIPIRERRVQGHRLEGDNGQPQIIPLWKSYFILAMIPVSIIYFEVTKANILLFAMAMFTQLLADSNVIDIPNKMKIRILDTIFLIYAVIIVITSFRFYYRYDMPWWPYGYDYQTAIFIVLSTSLCHTAIHRVRETMRENGEELDDGNGQHQHPGGAEIDTTYRTATPGRPNIPIRERRVQGHRLEGDNGQAQVIRQWIAYFIRTIIWVSIIYLELPKANILLFAVAMFTQLLAHSSVIDIPNKMKIMIFNTICLSYVGIMLISEFRKDNMSWWPYEVDRQTRNVLILSCSLTYMSILKVEEAMRENGELDDGNGQHQE